MVEDLLFSEDAILINPVGGFAPGNRSFFYKAGYSLTDSNGKNGFNVVGEITWNRNDVTSNDRTNNNKKARVSGDETLAHELVHGLNRLKGTMPSDVEANPVSRRNEEEKTVRDVNRLSAERNKAKDLGKKKRWTDNRASYDEINILDPLNGEGGGNIDCSDRHGCGKQ